MSQHERAKCVAGSTYVCKNVAFHEANAPGMQSFRSGTTSGITSSYCIGFDRSGAAEQQLATET